MGQGSSTNSPSTDNIRKKLPPTKRTELTSSESRSSLPRDNQIYLKPTSTDILTVPTVFRWPYFAMKVSVMGSFSNWTELIPLVSNLGESLIILNLPLGKHQFKFLVDGIWKIDTNLPTIIDQSGSKNNIVSISSSDLDVFEALDHDLADKKNQLDSLIFDKNFGKTIPSLAYYTQAEKSHGGKRSSLIETLPSNSFSSVLNTVAKSETENNPPQFIPDNACLNHLFALGIKDNILATSVTQRFRKKFVTTIYYRPVN